MTLPAPQIGICRYCCTCLFGNIRVLCLFQYNQTLDFSGTIKFAIPNFHSYGHIPECQVSTNNYCQHHYYFFQLKYSPLRNKGFGLTDGEVMERLWSFLRRFSRMTKEMRPEHRIDVLTSALLYYGYKTKIRLRKQFHD